MVHSAGQLTFGDGYDFLSWMLIWFAFDVLDTIILPFPLCHEK